MNDSRARLSVLAAVAAALVLGAASCGGGGSGGSGNGAAVKPAEVAGSVQLSGWASSPEETKLLKQVIGDFEQKYPKIKVKYSPISGDYPAAMLAKFSARRPPDVFYVDSNVAPDWIDQGLLAPLDGYIDKNSFDTSAFFPPLLEAFKGPDGKQYGLPKDWSPLAMFTNDKLLQQAGVQPPKTWDELRAAAQKLRVKGGKPICLAPDWARALAFVYENGGALLGDNGKQVVVDSQQTKAALEFYTGLVKDGLADQPSRLGAGWCGEALGKQKAAIVFEGNWLVPFMDSTFPKVEYSINPMVEGKQPGNLAFTVSYSMAKDSKNKQAAWVLLSYLTGPNGMATWTSKGLALPSRKDVQVPQGREPFIQAADVSKAWRFAPGFQDVITTANNEFTAVFEGKQTVDGMVQKVDAEAKRARGCAPAPGPGERRR